MGIYQQEAVEALHGAADLVVKTYNLKGAKLDAFVNAVTLLEYAFKRGLGRRDDIAKEFDHIRTFESVAKALPAVDALEKELMGNG